MKRPFLPLLAVLTLPLLCGALAHAQTPSVYVVDRTDDSTTINASNAGCSTAAGDCSLRGAVGRALTDGVNSTVSFDPTVFANAQTITLAGAQLIVVPNGTLTITGPAVGVTISGNNQSRVFLLAGSPTVSMSNLTIAKGAANGSTTFPGDANTDGAGIANTGALNLNNVNFSGNVARQNGGGLVNQGGTVTVTGGTFVGNGAGFGGGGFGSLGGTVTMTGTTFQSNQAVFGGGYISDQGTTTTVNDGVFTSNICVFSGGALVNSRGNATLNNCSFQRNAADGGGPTGPGALPASRGFLVWDKLEAARRGLALPRFRVAPSPRRALPTRRMSRPRPTRSRSTIAPLTPTPARATAALWWRRL